MNRSAIYCILFLLSASAAHSQTYWERTNGPIGGQMRSVVRGPGDKVIAGSQDGRIFYSDDNGENWNRADTVFGINVVDFVYCGDGSILAATVGSMGLHRSTDGGKSWHRAALANEEVWTLEKDPYGNIYAGTRTHGHVWKSTNDGYNWMISNSTTGSDSRYVNDIIYNQLTNSLFAAYNKYIQRSTDQGENWEILSSGIGAAEWILAMACDDSGNVYAGSDEQGGAIYLSTDNGDNWVNMDTSQTFGDIVNVGMFDMLAVADYLLVGTHSGVAKSNDMGQSWEFITNGLTSPDIIDFAYDTTTSTIYAANQRGGIFISNNYGDSWQLKSNGINLSTTTQLYFGKNDVLYTSSFDNGIHKSTDYGATWELIVNGITNFTHESIYETSDGYLITGTQGSYFVSTDSGNNWYEGNGFAGKLVNRIEEDPRGNWYFGIWGGPFSRSTDKGESWATAIDEFIFSIAVDSTGNIFAGTNHGRIFKSTDSGESWFYSDNGLTTGSTIMDIVVSPTGKTMYAGTYGHGIFKSTNEGENWIDISQGGLEDEAIFAIGVRNDKELFASAYNTDRLYYSSEGGGNWLYVSEGMYEVTTWDFVTDKAGYIYAATFESVWRTKTNKIITGIKEETTEASIPVTFHLYQNYPNPFNPTTKIKFTIPTSPLNPSPYQGEGKRERFITLNVYDILGRKITTLVNEEKSAGTYEVEFNGEQLSSGIYIYQLSSGNFTVSKKLLLIK